MTTNPGVQLIFIIPSSRKKQNTTFKQTTPFWQVTQYNWQKKKPLTTILILSARNHILSFLISIYSEPLNYFEHNYPGVKN